MSQQQEVKGLTDEEAYNACKNADPITKDQCDSSPAEESTGPKDSESHCKSLPIQKATGSA
ncbi:UNVERIFIED_CONTAM: hypothetical protein FKN15_077810 [Acipenser sinensis]